MTGAKNPLDDNPGLRRGRIGLMAMTQQVKAELAATVVTKSCCRKAEVSSMLRFAGGLHIQSGRIVVEAELDTGAAARRLRTAIADLFGFTSEFVVVTEGILAWSSLTDRTTLSVPALELMQPFGLYTKRPTMTPSS